MHAPQIIWIVIASSILTVTLTKHGQTYTGKYDISAKFFSILLNAALLYWGGFFG